MDKILVTGGSILNGHVSASGAKNAALPILFSTLLAEGEHTFDNVPLLKDIESTAELLQSLGCESSRDGHTFRVRVSKLKSFEAHYDLVRKMRASILCLGPMLAKYGIDPVHFGIVMIFNLGIGLLTPPVGPTLAVGCAIGKVSMEAVSKSIMVFYIPMIIVLLLVTYIPALTLWLPKLLLG